MPEAQRLPLKDLNIAVREAVTLASERRKITAEPAFGDGDFHLVPWWLIGRKLRDQINIDEAYEFAQQVSDGVNERLGIDVVPAVTIVDKDILCGFIERFGDNIEIPSGRFGGFR